MVLLPNSNYHAPTNTKHNHKICSPFQDKVTNSILLSLVLKAFISVNFSIKPLNHQIF